ncbi:MAG TPA: serine hydrolase domain-containing protein [Candidatus Polarisedimenticolaceae bacterium]|nr:serine hydrolase domain-containing protein [Candidatus Polarisedimenticolaceae bacterium]
MTRLLSPVLFALVVLSLSSSPSTSAPAAQDELIGLWGYSTSFGPMLQGPLEIERSQDTWRARFGGYQVAMDAKGDVLSVVFPERVGAFRGRLVGDRIEGFWLRRGITEDPRYPGGPSQPFATPVVLGSAGTNRWTGEVVPLKDRFKLYLKIFRNEEGKLLGAFRDPYGNDNGGASRFLVTREGDQVAFRQPNDAGGFDVWFKGSVQGTRLRIAWKDLGGEIELERRSSDDITMFFPRPPGAAPYVYRRPLSLEDGWKTARGRDVGMDEPALARAVQKILDEDPAGRRPSLVHSILIARHGKLVLEEYFFGFDRDTPHDLRSAGKTFSSVMLGAAMLRGTPISPDTKVYPLLAERGPFANPDGRKARITLAHLMTHSSGIACNDNDDASPGNEDTMQAQTGQPDWWKYTLDLPMAHEPGTRYAYCSASMNLMGAALTTATGTWLPEYFDRTVARPLGFGRYHWNLQPTDEGYLAGGAWLRPRDLLKVGQAYLDGGVWRGQRIVGKDWVEQSTLPRMHISPQTTGLTPEEFGNSYGEGDDAYAWHLGALKVGERSYRAYQASGNGGQILMVAPELDLVVVFTGGNYRQGGIWGRWPQDFVGDVILPAMRR